MKPNLISSIIKKWLWPVVAIALFAFFVVIPLCKVGLWKYAFDQREINPFISRLYGIYDNHKAKQLSKSWYERIEIENGGGNFQSLIWEEDTISSNGINSIYCLDQQADEIRPLLMKEWGLPFDKSQWPTAQQTGSCYFNPSIASPPIYDIERTDSMLHIHTGSKPDTWVWLVGKVKQPTTYRIDFDFISHTKTQETLQICFASKSLASRFRFNLENNETLEFEVVDNGRFLYWPHPELWQNLRKPCSIPLHKPVHVSLRCINNYFAIYYDNALKMAVSVKGYKAVPNYWYLIFWNGTPNGEHKGKQDNFIDIEISNLKIYHRRDNKSPK